MNRRLLAPPLFLVLALAAGVSPTAHPAESHPFPDRFDVQAIDTFLAAHQKSRGPAGLSVSIVRDGQVVLAKAYGRRSIEDNRPAEADTLFAIGSVSKQFTCACVLLLHEEGKLSVHDKVAKYYPGLTRAGDITLLDLMNHTSGYPDYYPLDFVERPMQRPIQEDELLRRYAGGKLDFEPRTQWSYSNTGYILLGRIVEKVAGEAFGSFLSRRILKPLGMEQTVYEPELSDPRLARGYTTFALGPLEPNVPEGKGWVAAAGGLWSTPADLVLWNLALVAGRVLKPEAYRLMTTPAPLDNGKVTDYGCGLTVRVQGGRQVLNHTGAVNGFATWNSVIPSTRSALTMICNEDGGLGDLPGRVFALLLKEPSNIPEIQGLVATEMARKVLTAFQKSRVDRTWFAEEFNAYLTEERLEAAGKRLKAFGAVQGAELIRAHERGGMEVSWVRLRFQSTSLRTQMHRKPDGRIEQYFVYPD